MVEHQTEIDEVFHALSHSARRDMIGRLSSGELTVGDLAAPFSMSLEAASKHVRVLEHAGLVKRTVVGRRHICRLDPQPLALASNWLQFYEHFWAKKLDALESLFPPNNDTMEDV